MLSYLLICVLEATLEIIFSKHFVLQETKLRQKEDTKYMQSPNQRVAEPSLRQLIKEGVEGGSGRKRGPQRGLGKDASAGGGAVGLLMPSAQGK